MSIVQAASCRSSMVHLAPLPIRKPKKKKARRARQGPAPAVDCDDRRDELKRMVDYGCTRMSLFLRKEDTHFKCGCCFKTYPNKEVLGKVVTDNSSLPACKRCSDTRDLITRRLRKAVDGDFGVPDKKHPVAAAMQAAAKSHRGQHGDACAACVFVATCRRAHQWSRLDFVDKALSTLKGCPRKWAVGLIALADAQARARVRGRNQAKVDKTCIDTQGDVLKVCRENMRSLIERVERCAGVLHVEVPNGTEAKEAPALARREAQKRPKARPAEVPMFVRVKTASGRHLGVYTNDMTAVATDETVRDKLDTWYRVAAALGV